jgi:hypothetical protein
MSLHPPREELTPTPMPGAWRRRGRVPAIVAACVAVQVGIVMLANLAAHAIGL